MKIFEPFEAWLLVNSENGKPLSGYYESREYADDINGDDPDYHVAKALIFPLWPTYIKPEKKPESARLVSVLVGAIRDLENLLINLIYPLESH